MPNVIQYSDYRTFLNDAFLERQGRNAAYSKRAFARDLGVSATFLCHILMGKKDLSYETTIEIGRRLMLSPGESELLYCLVQAGSAGSFEAKSALAFRRSVLVKAIDEKDLGGGACAVEHRELRRR